MSSGLVAKKIALFEHKPQPPEHICRLKRKHAIRRKKYRRERKSIADSGISTALSEERLNDPTLFYASSRIANSFSASCSALLDLIYNPERSTKMLESETPSSPVFNLKDFTDKRILCRSSSLEEAFPARLNIIDIDIEIRVEKKSRSPSPDAYELIEPLNSTNFLEKIKLTAKMDNKCHKNKINNCTGFGSGGTTSENYSSSSSSANSNYYCSSCGNYNTNSDTLQEHIYENFALIPPPRPPKRQPTSSLFIPSSVYSSDNNLGDLVRMANNSLNGSRSVSASPTNPNCPNTKDVLGSVILSGDELSKTPEISDNNTNPEVLSDNKNENDKEPLYEDLYDYCNPPEDLTDFNFDFLQPASVTSFFNDKDDEVEYCDCSTVMAMAINSLNSGGTVIYNTDFQRTVDSPSRTIYNGWDSSTTTDPKKEGDDETKGLKQETTHTKKRSFYLGSLTEGGDEFTTEFTNTTDTHNPVVSPTIRSSPVELANPNNGSCENERTYGKDACGVVDEGTELVTNDSKDKKDEDDLNKPLPILPSTCSSSNSSDSFYSEPIYGVTTQITNYTSGTRNPGPPVPDTLRRPSLSPNPLSQSVISCNNVIRTDPKPISRGLISKTPTPSTNSGVSNGLTYGDGVIYADSVSTQSQLQTVQSRDGGFEPNDKLPPIPPSKFSSIAKSAGRRLAKKFMGIRKTSKSSLENYELPSSSSSSTNGSIMGNGNASGGRLSSNSNSPVPKLVSGATTPVGGNGGGPETKTYSVSTKTVGGNSSQSQLKRPVSRPNIPPPEPPKSVYGGSSNGSANNYSIYEKSDPTSRPPVDDDDFDDSDFYDSDSELIRNFVSQVQPIYSMEEEPLYQYYAYGISIKPDDDYQPVIPKNLGLTLDMLVPRVGQRTLWCELSEVIASGILSILSYKQKQLQESIFEILTSEVSYLKSLDVLLTVFYKNEELIGVLSGDEKGCLFGNIEEVRECAQSFLAELLAKWDESWYIQDIGEIIHRNTNTRFAVYKEYCRNKPHQDKVMNKLRHSRDEFVNVIKTLEEDTRCQMLRIDSFLMLPMQRITRLPLLVNAVIQRTTSVKEKANCEEALKSLTNLVLECNEAARESQDAEETSSILDKLEFTRGSKPLSSLGQFIMKGDFMKNPFDQGRGAQHNWTFRKSKRTMYWLMMFSNQLLITKKKANGKFEVLDMCPPEEGNIKPLPNLEAIANDFQNFFMLHFDKKETVYFLAARTNSEIERWKSKLDSMKTTKQLRVESIFPYEALRADELSFSVGDIVEVAQMQPDGWYYGTKVNGGQSGWFPGNYCCEL